MASSGPAKSPKKANLLDPHSIKHVLDESVTEVVTGRGYAEDVRLSNLRLLIGTVIIAIALIAQFYPKKFPENRDFLIVCIVLYPSSLISAWIYVNLKSRNFDMFFWGNRLIFNSGKYIVLNGVLQFISYNKEKNAILFTYPPAGSFNSTGLIVSSKLPRFSDIYTLTVASSDPKSISANKPVQLTKSITKWFTKHGVLAEGLFWKDVERLIDDYNGERKNK